MGGLTFFASLLQGPAVKHLPIALPSYPVH